MNRAPVFSAIKSLRQGKAFSPAEVIAIDSLLGTLGIAPASNGEATPIAIGLTLADFRTAAATLGCTSVQIRAVWEVESGGGWFTDVRSDILALDGPGGFLDGPHLPKILFEAHVFDRRTAGRYRDSHPNLSSRVWNRKLYIGGQGEYVRLWKAMQLDRHAALMSASVGGAQIRPAQHAHGSHAHLRSIAPVGFPADWAEFNGRAALSQTGGHASAHGHRAALSDRLRIPVLLSFCR